MNITIQGTQMDLTEAIKAKVNEKMLSVEKYFEGITHIDVDVGKRGNHSDSGAMYYAEVNVSVPGKKIRVVKDDADLYKAIEKVKDHLKVEFEKVKGKMRHIEREEIRETKQYHIDDEN